MALRCLLAVLVAAAVGVASKSPAPEALNPELRDLPCPDEMLIKPCTCHTHDLYDMTLDCSLINTNEDLERVFNVSFPFKHFLQLIIDHDPDDDLNKLTEIKSDTFHDLTFERVLIRGTQLMSIDENVFSYSHKTLVQLDLQNNKISDFPFESLSNYENLATLLLDKNELGTLEKFSSESLATLSVGSNPNLYFTDDVLEEIPNLRNLNMENIGLKEIPRHMFQNLTVYSINFNDNELTVLEEYTLDPLKPSVGRLLLANNKINDSISNSFTGLLADAVVDLTNNKITLMTEEIWRPFLDQVLGGMVDLTGNPLKCGCDMSWMFLDTTDIYLNILTDHTTCFDGTQVAFLDVKVFEKHCS